jgi:hypothetical protein
MIIKTNRTKPRVQILRGWDLVSTSTLHQVHAVKAGQEDIKSGMIISRVWNGTLGRYEWTKGVTANEIQTGYFKTGQTYNADVLLTFDGTTGGVKPAAEGNYVIGRVTRNQGVKSLNPAGVALFYENSETTPANSSVITFETANMGFAQAVDAPATTSTP